MMQEDCNSLILMNMSCSLLTMKSHFGNGFANNLSLGWLFSETANEMWILLFLFFQFEVVAFQIFLQTVDW